MDDGVHDGIDAMRAVVVGPSAGGAGGSGGVVARFPGVVCVVGPSGGGPGGAGVRALLDLCLAAADAAEDGAPGRALGRSLARWLAGPDAPDDLVFGTVAAADDRVAVFLSGAVTARLPGTASAADAVLSGLDAVSFTDRLVPRPRGPLVLTLDATPVPDDVGARPHDLRAGIVPGSGLALLPPGVAPDAVPAAAPQPTAARPVPEPAVPEPAVEPAAPPPAAEVATPPAPRAPRRSDRIAGPDGGSGGAVPPRPPLADGGPPGWLRRGGPAPSPHGRPPHGPAPLPPAPPGPGRPDPESGPTQLMGAGRRPPDPDDVVTEQARDPLARGFVCARGHLNDPRSHFCVLCGIRMNERTGVLTVGPRPPLGLLVFDDGATYTVDAEYVVGRLPDGDERVRRGELRALMVDDRGATVGRVHAEVRLRDWDVQLVDVGSRNGTYVVPPGGAAWERMPARTPLRLEPGTRVRLGHHRTFVFESPSGVR